MHYNSVSRGCRPLSFGVPSDCAIEGMGEDMV